MSACNSRSTAAIPKVEFPVGITHHRYRWQPLISFKNRQYSIPAHRRITRRSDFRAVSSLVDNLKLTSEASPPNEIKASTWTWRGYTIRYQYSGTSGPALVLIHGFGANSDHWRKNLPVLAESHRVYAIDLIGYGYSDKPNPRELQVEHFYTFETWASQLNDFCTEIVKDKVFFVCNSIGGRSHGSQYMQWHNPLKYISSYAARKEAALVRKAPNKIIPEFAKVDVHLMGNTSVGKFFFNTVATAGSVKSILSQVTDELVKIILDPGLEPGAAEVFLEFICYSDGPLPEELLPLVKCPVLVVWGDKDPWEPIELGRAYARFDSVEDFVVLPDVGHCPQDEAPHLVNPLVTSFVAQHASPPTTP